MNKLIEKHGQLGLIIWFADKHTMTEGQEQETGYNSVVPRGRRRSDEMDRGDETSKLN